MATRSKPANKHTLAGDTARVAAPVIGEESVETFDTYVGSSTAVYAHPDAKNTLIDLNGRLANYIELVRGLETQNAQLMLKVREFELQTQKRETDKTDYKQQNHELRRQLEDITSMRVRLEMEKTRAEKEYSELCTLYQKNQDNLVLVMDDREKLQQRTNAARTELELAEARLQKAEKKSESLKQRLPKYIKENSELKSLVQNESMLRAELQGRIDNELKTYEDLLQGEEERLNITSSEASHQSSSRSLNVSFTEPRARPKTLGSRADVKNEVRPSRKRRHSAVRAERFYDFSDDVDEDVNRSWLGRLFSY